MSKKESIKIKNELNIILSKYFIPDLKKIKQMPQIMNKAYIDYVITSTGKWIIIAFLSQETLEKCDKYFKEYNDPFPGLISSPDMKTKAAYHLQKSNYNYFKNITIKNMYSFELDIDCSFIIENHHQSIKTPKGEDIDYIIDLAYVISFSENIKINNFFSIFDSLVEQSVRIWKGN